MKMRTKTPIKKAAEATAAGQIKLQKVTYPKFSKLSRGNLRENLGLLLLHLQNPLTQKQSRAGWQLFEILLLQYVQGVPDKPRLKNSVRRVSE